LEKIDEVFNPIINMDMDFKDYLRFQIYKNRVFNRAIGKEFYDTLDSFRNSFHMSFNRAVSEINSSDLGQFASINQEENLQLIFQVMDYLFSDDEYRNILERFRQLFDLTSIVEAKSILDTYSMVPKEYQQVEISNSIDQICSEYQSFIALRQTTYQKFLQVCHTHGIHYSGSEHSLVHQLSKGDHGKLLSFLSPENVESVNGSLSVKAPSLADEIIGENKLTFSRQLLKLFMIVAFLTIHGHEGQQEAPDEQLALACQP
jgi:hypothetical protein